MITKNYNNTFNEIITELERAKVHPKFHSFHEFYGVLMEEVEELFDEIKKKQQDKQRIKEEAIQVAAMVFKMIDNLIEE